MDTAHMWAASYNMLWNKVCVTDNSGGENQAICMGPKKKVRGTTLLPAGATLYFPVEKIRTTRQLVTCQVCPRGAGVQNITVARPFVIKPSLHYFLEFWDRVKAGEELGLYAVSFSNLRVSYEQPGQPAKILADLKLSRFGDIECTKLFDLLKSRHGTTKSSQTDGSKASGSKNEAACGNSGDDPGNNDDEDEEEEEFGLHLLVNEYASCLGEKMEAVSSMEAVQASFDEANCTAGGCFDAAAADEVAQMVAGLVDDDLQFLQDFEESVLQKAISEKRIEPEELTKSIDNLCRDGGLQVEDAVFEAALNSSKLMGNEEFASEPSRSSSSSAGFDGAAASTSNGDVASLCQSHGKSLCQVHEVSKHQLCRATQAFSSNVVAAITNSWQALLQCFRALQSRNPGGDGLSIGLSPTDVAGTPSFGTSRRLVLISWEVAGKTGRIARIDGDGKLVSMVCVGPNRYARNLENCLMIHPGIGLNMERVKKKERTSLPPFALRVRDMFLQLESLGLLAVEQRLREAEGQAIEWQQVAETSEDPCAFCSCHLPSRSEGDVLLGLPTKCPLCLITCHAHCATIFLQQLGQQQDQGKEELQNQMLRNLGARDALTEPWTGEVRRW